MQGHQLFALTLMAALAGCQTQRPVTAPVPVTPAEPTVQGTVVGDERTSMQAAVDAGSSAGARPRDVEFAGDTREILVLQAGHGHRRPAGHRVAARG